MYDLIPEVDDPDTNAGFWSALKTIILFARDTHVDEIVG
jgi:hypothetical protein